MAWWRGGVRGGARVPNGRDAVPVRMEMSGLPGLLFLSLDSVGYARLRLWAASGV